MSVISVPNTGIKNRTLMKFLQQLADAANRGSFLIQTVATTPFEMSPLQYTVLVDATSSAVVINLPLSSRAKGRIYNIKKIDASANAVTLTPQNSELIDGAATKSTTTQYANFTIQNDGTGWWIL
jgi:hypothetical protein